MLCNKLMFCITFLCSFNSVSVSKVGEGGEKKEEGGGGDGDVERLWRCCVVALESWQAGSI